MFADIAPKYFEQNLFVIPLGGKIPLVKNWSFFSTTAPSDLLNDSWCTKYPKSNIGLLTGKLSGVIAVDIDKESALKIVPPSPVVKKGKKGETRFFKYNGESNLKRLDLGIEILSTGNQTVLPPSIHPETKEPYKWISQFDLLSFDVEDLPVLDAKFLESIGQIPTLKSDNLGRHNALIEICGAMVGRGEDATAIIEELIKFDKENHEKPYFDDKDEPHKGSGYFAALAMYASVAKTSARKGEFVEPKKIEIKLTEKEIQKQIDDSQKTSQVIYPEPVGIIKELQDLILSRSNKPRPKFALASALSIVGTILSNKVKYFDSTPNLYQLIIADSGEGKDAPLKAGKKIFVELGLLHLLGLESYRGDKSIVKRFESQRERLDIIDEISKLFRSLNSSNIFSSNIAETLTEIWNSSNDLFAGFTTSEDTTGMVFNPCLSIMGATTPNSFSETFSNSLLMQGFGARFLYFFDDSKVNLVEVEKKEISEKLKNFFEFWGNMEIAIERVDISKTGTVKFDFSQRKPQAVTLQDIEKPIVVDLPISNQAKERLFEIMHYFHEMSYVCNEQMKPIVQRAYQQTKKIMIIDAVSRSNENNPSPLIQVESVNFAFKLVEATIKETDLFFKENLIQSRFHKESQKVIRVLKRFPAGLTQSELTRKLVSQFKATELYDKKSGIVTNLVEAGTVLAFQAKADGAKKATIRFVYDRSK